MADSKTMRYGKWEVMHELGIGGRGKVFVVRDSTRNDLEGGVIPGIHPKFVSLNSSQSTEIHALSAQELCDYMKAYITRDTIENCKALKVIHQNVRKNGKAFERLKREVEVLTNQTTSNREVKNIWHTLGIKETPDVLYLALYI